MSTQSPKALKPRSKTYYIHAAIGLLFMFGFGYLPATDPITPMGMEVIGIFIGLVYLFSFCEITWPAIAAIIALGMSSYSTVPAVVASSLGHAVVFQSLMAYIVTGCLQYYGIVEHIARWLLSRKAFKGRPELFMLTYFMTFLLVSIFVSSIAVIILGWTIFYGIAEMIGYKKGESFTGLSIVGIMVSFVVGGAIAPIRGWPLTLANQFAEAAGTSINLISFLAISFPAAVLTMVVFLLGMKFLFKVDFEKMRAFDVETLANKEPMSTRQTIILIVNAVVMLFILLASLLPAGSSLGKKLNALTPGGIFAVAAIVLVLICLKGREPLIDFRAVAATNVSWDVILMIGATMVAASALTSADTGVLDFTKKMLMPVFEGKSPTFLLLFVVLILTLLTNIGSNIGMGAMMIPVVAPFISVTGANASVIGTAIIYMAAMGLFLPGASAPAALTHSNDWLTKKEVYKYSFYALIVIWVVTIPILMIANAVQ